MWVAKVCRSACGCVGVGLRQRKGRLTDEVCIVVMVRSKRAPGGLPSGEALPARIEGVPVDVQEIEVDESEVVFYPPSQYRTGDHQGAGPVELAQALSLLQAAEQRDKVLSYYARARADGATVVTGGGTGIGRAAALALASIGYTLLVCNEAGLSLAPELTHITKVDVPYKVERDFVPVSLLGHYGSLLTISPDLPVKTLSEYIAYAKKNPKKINYASFGVGSQPQIMMETFNKMVGIDTVHLPYKGVALAVTDLIAGHVQSMISAPSTPMPHVREQRLRALAYSGSKRLPELPDVPTFSDAGLPGFNPRGWFGAVMHASTPAPIRNWLSETIWSVVQSSEYQINAILKNGYEMPTTEPAAMAEFLQEDRNYWKRTMDLVRHRLV